MDDLGLLIALMDGISADNAKKLGSIGIEYIDTNATGTGFIFYMADNTTVDVPLSMNFLFSNKYDPNKDGSVVKSDTLQLKNSSTTFLTGEQLLARENHTGTQKADTITLDKTNFNEFLKDFQGSTIQDLALYLNSHKVFLNGLFVGDNLTEGNFKIISENNKLKLQRLENGTYNTVYTVGSNETDIINLNKQYSAINFTTSNTNNLNLARISTDSKSIQIGDARLDKLYISGKELLSYKVEDTYTSRNYIINNDTSLTQPLSTWEFTVNIPIQNNFSYCAIHGVEINNTTTGYYNYQIIDVLTGDVAYYGGSAYELKAGLTKQLTQTGLHTETLSKLIHLYCGKQYKFVFTTQAPISFKGGLINSVFKPYCVFKYYLVTVDEMVSMEKVTDSVSSNSSSLVASAKAVYTIQRAISSIVSGSNPLVPISVESFNALTEGLNGDRYILIDDGIIGEETLHTKDIIYIVTDFKDRPIKSDDYVPLKTNNSSGGGIFITDIQALASGKNVQKIMNDPPNQGSVKLALSDDNAYRVFIEWDRAQEFQGSPTVNDKPPLGVQKLASSYTGYVDLVSTDITTDGIIALFNDNTYAVPFAIVTPPSITSFNISGTYPTTNVILQTELKENDQILCSIETDKDIDIIEFVEEGAFKYQTINVTAGKSFNNIVGIIANKGDVSQQLNGKIRVHSTEGSWSDYVLSSNVVTLNNIKPSITLDTKTFSSGLSALKNSETCVVKAIATNYDTLVSSAIGTDLTVASMSGLNCTVTRVGGIYNDSVANLRITGNKVSNGASGYLDICVEIANVAPTLSSQSLGTYNVSSGLGTVINTLTFNQNVKIKSISVLDINKGTLATGITTSYAKTYDLGISSQDSDIHSNTTNSTNIVVTGLSGIDSVSPIPINYYIRGFANKILTFVYSSLSKSIGTSVVDVTKLVVNGYILTSPLFEICKILESNPVNINNDTADYYAISSDKLNFLLPEAVKQFGYTTGKNIQINISEVY